MNLENSEEFLQSNVVIVVNRANGRKIMFRKKGVSNLKQESGMNIFFLNLFEVSIKHVIHSNQL